VQVLVTQLKTFHFAPFLAVFKGQRFLSKLPLPFGEREFILLPLLLGEGWGEGKLSPKGGKGILYSPKPAPPRCRYGITDLPF